MWVEESRIEKSVGRRQRKQDHVLLAGLCPGSSYCPGLHPALVLPALPLLEQGFLLLSAQHLHPGTFHFSSVDASWSSVISFLFHLNVEPGLGVECWPACPRCLGTSWVQFLIPAWSHICPCKPGGWSRLMGGCQDLSSSSQCSQLWRELLHFMDHLASQWWS